MKKSKRVSSRGALLAVDVALVERVWRGMPASEAFGLVAKARPPLAGAPGEPEPFDATGLDMALSLMTTRKTVALPLAQALAAKRATGIPWRWLTTIPDARAEMRADERLVHWAEGARLPDLSAGDVIVLTSLVEKTMIGATEAREAFSRWELPAFARGVEDADENAIEAVLLDAWDDAAPLLALTGLDDEADLWALAKERLASVRAMVRFARERSLALVPWSDDIRPDWLARRARARTSAPAAR